MSGTWAKTLFATTRSAWPFAAAIFSPVPAPRKVISVGTPRSTARAAVFAVGSIPSERMPRATACWRRYPSLLATSTMNELRPSCRRSTADSTNRFACATQESLYEEK